MATITSANAIYWLSIPAIFPVPQQLQGFAADEVFGTEPIPAGEALMGVDGVLSAGFVYAEKKQTIALQADSASNAIFDTWYNSEATLIDKFPASGLIHLPSLGLKFNMPKGFLMTYMPIPDAKRRLEPRRQVIFWEKMIPGAI